MPLTDKEKDELLNKSIQYRGKMLNAMANIELLLNGYLARHFCGNDIKKVEEIILLVFGDDRTTLSAKAQMLAHIATTHDKKWYSEYKSVRKPEPGKKPYSLNSDLAYIIQERNVFAHRLFVMGDDLNGNPTPENVMRFAKFKNDVEPLDYTDEKLQYIYSTIITIGRHLAEKISGLEVF